jgi:hypothetical protein
VFMCTLSPTCHEVRSEGLYILKDRLDEKRESEKVNSYP